MSLDKKITYNDSVITYKEFIETLIRDGYLPKIEKKPLVQFNRVKYNQLSGLAQEEYDKKCHTYKDSYIMEKELSPNKIRSYVITKEAYVYANSFIEKN